MQSPRPQQREKWRGALLCKAELLKIREPDAKPQWVHASLLALSTLLWRREVPAHEGLRGGFENLE